MMDSVLSPTIGNHWTREALDARRQAIAEAHARGATGVEVVTALTDLADEILLDLYHSNQEAAGMPDRTGVALVALGGYGRRELAPYSDIDLMFLYASPNTPSGISDFRSVTVCGQLRIAGRWAGRISPCVRP